MRKEKEDKQQKKKKKEKGNKTVYPIKRTVRICVYNL